MHRKIGFTLVAALVVASVGTATVTRAAGGGGAAGGGAAGTAGPAGATGGTGSMGVSGTPNTAAMPGSTSSGAGNPSMNANSPANSDQMDQTRCGVAGGGIGANSMSPNTMTNSTGNLSGSPGTNASGAAGC